MPHEDRFPLLWLRRVVLMGGPGSGRQPRAYPQHIVELATSLYLDGMTVREVQDRLPCGYKAQRILERHLPERRKPAKRDQHGPANHMWKGSDAGYQALHLRVQAARGTPSLCEECGTTEGRFEWANLTGKYEDINDFARMCVACHRNYDAQRRAITGRRTMPTKEVMPHV